ncbi:MAG: ABC transporter permease [Bacteroidota bacterium]
MKLLLKLGWRNIWRNKRRSLLTILAVVFAVFLTIVMRGAQVGTWEENIKTMAKMFSGYVQIQREGYQKNPSLQLCLVQTDSLRILIAGNPAIAAATPRIYGEGLASYKEHSLGVMILGISPATEQHVSTFQSRLNRGTFFSSDTGTAIVVGYKLLQNLNAVIGDTIVVLAQGIDGSLGNMKYTIIGTVKTGAPEFDAMGIFMGLAAAQDLLGMQNRVHAIVLTLNNLDDIPGVQHYLTQSLDTHLAAVTWEDVNPDLKQHMEMDTTSAILYAGILMVIVAFGILNTVLMSVTERFREFGVSLSMGMPNSTLVKLIFIETAFMAAVGIIIGNIIAAITNYTIIVHPIIIGGNLGDIYQQYGFMPKIVSSLKFHLFRNASISIFIISLISCIYPAYRVSKLEPLQGLHHV